MLWVEPKHPRPSHLGLCHVTGLCFMYSFFHFLRISVSVDMSHYLSNQFIRFTARGITKQARFSRAYGL